MESGKGKEQWERQKESKEWGGIVVVFGKKKKERVFFHLAFLLGLLRKREKMLERKKGGKIEKKGRSVLMWGEGEREEEEAQ